MFARSEMLWSVLAVACLACGGNPGGQDGTDAARVDTPPPPDCVNDGCTPDLVCNPANGVCEPIPCNTHSDCAEGNYCGPSGVCVPSNTGGPCDDDGSCTNGESCIGGFCACRGQQFEAEGVPPNVLIVLDRSGSMGEIIGSMSKWQIAVSAIGSLLSSHGAQVRFGLDLFEPPTGGSCGAGAVMVDVGTGTTAQINTTLAQNGPGGLTPIGATLNALTTYAGLHDPTRENYVLLITDGSESCGASNSGLLAVNALRAGTPDIKTFVVGFGSGVDVAAMNAMAQAGGTAQAGAMSYYQADNAASLATAFDAIGAAVLSCTYTLTGQPDENSMFVRFDGVDIMRDPTHQNGWDYDPVTNQIVFFGAACMSLRSGDVTDLVVGSGCSVG